MQFYQGLLKDELPGLNMRNEFIQSLNNCLTAFQGLYLDNTCEAIVSSKHQLIVYPAIESTKLFNRKIMAQSLVQNNLHIIFATKYREPLIDTNIEAGLYHYMAGICDNLECPAIKIGGHLDHVHIACSLSKKIALIDFLEELKKSSSKWIKKRGMKYEDFYWQGGYGAFSVSPSKIDQLVLYIENQHLHHQKISFQDEYRALLKKYKVEYDERYVRD